MEKQTTIAGTMKAFMAEGPSITEYPNYKALNDAVGAIHGLAAGKCQALAGPKAWDWTPDQTLGHWRVATREEIETRRAAAANKVHGTRKAKMMTAEDRAALDAQVAALEAVNNPALAPLLADLLARQTADDLARKGSMKDRLEAQIERLGIEKVVAILEAEAEAEAPAEAEAGNA